MLKNTLTTERSLDKNMSSKTAVITGSSKGIGASTAEAFAKEGYNVVINYSNDKKAAKEVASSIKGVEVLLVKADVFKEEGVEILLKAVKEKFGTIDVLVNNAGMPEEPAFGSYDYKAVEKSIGGNFISAVLCTQAFAPIVNDGGSILFTSSIYGLNYGGNIGLPLYSAGKAAIINFSQTLAEKLAPNIRCNVVAPGVTKTPAWDGVSADYIEQRHGMALQKEWVEADEIAKAFIFLATTPHMNAATIVVDAGWMKKFPENKI